MASPGPQMSEMFLQGPYSRAQKENSETMGGSPLGKKVPDRPQRPPSP